MPARCVVLRVRCPGPLGSCSPVCPLGVLCRVCGVLGPLAPVHRCARPVCCVPCTVSWPLGSCSPVCSLGVLCGVCGVVGHLAPVHRYARSVCCAVGCVCGVACVGRRCRALTRSSGRRLARSRQGLGTLQVRTRPSGWRLFRSRQGLGIPRLCTHPSGRQLFRSRQGLGSLPGAHTSVRTAAGVAWHLFSCRGWLRVVRALRGCGTRRPLLLGTCPFALVVAGGVPLWRASWPRVVGLASSGPVASGCSGRLSRRCGALPQPTGMRPRAYWVAARGTRTPAENPPHCACRWPLLRPGRWARSASYPIRAPRWGCPWRVPLASVLGCVRCSGWRVWAR